MALILEPVRVAHSDTDSDSGYRVADTDYVSSSRRSVLTNTDTVTVMF